MVRWNYPTDSVKSDKRSASVVVNSEVVVSLEEESSHQSLKFDPEHVTRTGLRVVGIPESADLLTLETEFTKECKKCGEKAPRTPSGRT